MQNNLRETDKEVYDLIKKEDTQILKLTGADNII